MKTDFAITVDVEGDYWDEQRSDGVVSGIPIILELFDRLEAKGTFFWTADMARKHPNIVTRVLDAGHEIGCHGFYHENFIDLNEKQQRKVIKEAVQLFQSFSTDKWMVLTILMIFFLLWGLVLDAVTATVIMVPIFLPLVQEAGIDLVHFGILVVMNTMIGNSTPPMGLTLFLTGSLARVRLEELIKEIIPFLIALLLVLFLCTYIPALVLWLPTLLMK